MENKHRLEFATRLNELCDDMALPKGIYAREKALGAKFGVSSNGARKWLQGDAYPGIEKVDEIVAWGKIQFEWMMTGRGDKHQASPLKQPSAREYSLTEPQADYETSVIQGKFCHTDKTIHTVIRLMELMSQTERETVLTVVDGLAKSYNQNKKQHAK